MSRLISRRFQFHTVVLLLVFAPVLQAQLSSGSLQQHYNEAEKLQQTGKLNDAAGQYRAFLAEALGELGMGYSLARDYKQAAASFNDALALEPASTSLLLDSARTALTLGDLDKAKSLATKVIQTHTASHPQLAGAHQLLGRALLHQNQDQQARKELEAAVALDPTFANGYDLAVACLNLDDDKCAAQIFGDIEKSVGDTPELHLALGSAYGESDFQPRAVAEFRRAIQENPRLPGAHYMLAAALLATGADQTHVDAAEDALKQELIISPRNAAAYAALGKLEANRNHFATAEQYLKKAIVLDPQNPDPCLFLGQMYFSAHNYAAAEPWLRRSIQLTADPSRNRYQIQRAHFLLGRILVLNGQRDAAQKQMQLSRELANQALSQDRSKLSALLDTNGSPGTAAASPDVRADAAKIDSQALRKIEARRRQLGPAIADSYNNLGAISATNSDYSDAVNYFERAAVWNPFMTGIDYNLGRAAFAASRFADAVAPLVRYVKAHPSDIGARSVLGISQFMVNNYPGCVQALRPVAENAALAPEVEYVYAESLVRTGQIASGMDRLKALEKSHPEVPDVHRALADAYTAAMRPADARREMEIYHALQVRAQSTASSQHSSQ